MLSHRQRFLILVISLSLAIFYSCNKTDEPYNAIGEHDGEPCLDIPAVTWGGQTYHTVQIGSQCWMKENLNIGTMISGSEDMLDNDTIEKYCYNNEPENCEIYGGLYQWNELMMYAPWENSIGICPDGWHIPSKNDWYELFSYVGGVNAGGMLKATGFVYWTEPNGGATNETSFTALPGGYRTVEKSFTLHGFRGLGEQSDYWTSSPLTVDHAESVGFNYLGANYSGGTPFKESGNSVRCIQN